ncbi:MAG: hypothetical protein Roseis2KO_31460 [Roseivirga sp.]
MINKPSLTMEHTAKTKRLKGKKLLIFGFTLSVISIIFNVTVSAYYANEVADIEDSINSIKSVGVRSSQKLTSAEQFMAFGNLYLAHAVNLNKGQDRMPEFAKYFNDQRYRSLVTAVNYSLFSILKNPKKPSDLEKEEINAVESIFSKYNQQIEKTGTYSITNEDLRKIDSLFKRHLIYVSEALEKDSVELISLAEQKIKLEKHSKISNSFAVSLQVLGLLFIFLKDFKSED